MLSNCEARERVLVALCGLSPAVLTETVWSLANTPGELPIDRIVVLTTVEGRERIRQELIANRVWACMLAALPTGTPKPSLSDTAFYII